MTTSKGNSASKHRVGLTWVGNSWNVGAPWHNHHVGNRETLEAHHDDVAHISGWRLNEGHNKPCLPTHKLTNQVTFLQPWSARVVITDDSSSVMTHQ